MKRFFVHYSLWLSIFSYFFSPITLLCDQLSSLKNADTLTRTHPAGTIDTNFGNNGQVNIGAQLTRYSQAVPVVILPMPDGSQYIAWTIPLECSFITRFTNENILDTTYGQGGYSAATNYGVTAMFMDGQNRLVLTGSYMPDWPTAWSSRYVAGDSGAMDSAFNDGYGIFIYDIIFTCMLQQSMSRYIAAGQDENGHVCVFAFNDNGYVDMTFNSNSENPGRTSFSIPGIVPSVIADMYDRLYIPVRNYFTGQLAIFRLTSSGEIDTTFSQVGSFNILLNNDDGAQIRLVFDASGNIVIVAHELRSENDVLVPYIGIAAVDQAGDLVYPQFLIAGLNQPTLTSVIATSDGAILIAGYQSGNNDMWIARVVGNQDNEYQLDTTFAASPAIIPGILQFSFDSSQSVTARDLLSIAMYPDGMISILGTETDSVITSFMSRAYNGEYVTENSIALNGQPVGTNDHTFGVISPDANGIEFLATTRSPLTEGQIAQAIALQDDQTIIVAIDGQLSDVEPRIIYMNAFDVDGLVDLNFNQDDTPGTAVVLDTYDNQYVRDILTFTDVDGIARAILTGYVTNTALGCSNSLLVQYLLGSQDGQTSAGMDQFFGGANGDPLGVALGIGASQGFVVNRQSIGRIIVGGIDTIQNIGLLQAYTSTGLLDTTFGTSGYYRQGTTGIYVAILNGIDELMIAYNDGSGNLMISRILADGSSIDTVYGDQGICFLDYDGMLTANDSFRIVLDQNNNLFVVAILQEGSLIVVNKLDPNGHDIVASSTFDASYFADNLQNFNIAHIGLNQSGALMVSGSDDYSILVVQIVQDHQGFLILDQQFNSAQTPGYLRYTITDIRSNNQDRLTDGLIHPDGRYIVCGANSNGVV